MSQDMLNIVDENKVTIDTLSLPLLTEKKVQADVLRLDKIHPVISGNKWFKLKYFLKQAIEKKHRTVLSYGGAYSNHIIALACAANKLGLPAVGIIRGERPRELSHTLMRAEKYGMQLLFLSREEFSLKNEPAQLEDLEKRFPGVLIIPEGGASQIGAIGSREILSIPDMGLYTHIICAIGTGTMYCGLAESLAKNHHLIGICILKGMTDLSPGLREYINQDRSSQYQIIPDYHFGGYAKQNSGLIAFMNSFFEATGIATDFVYTAKMFYAITDMVKKEYFPPLSRLIIIHSGGLQGNESLAPGTLHF
jgi:1-aminocyclopropane-1-carboxylate deaminase